MLVCPSGLQPPQAGMKPYSLSCKAEQSKVKTRFCEPSVGWCHAERHLLMSTALKRLMVLEVEFEEDQLSFV